MTAAQHLSPPGKWQKKKKSKGTGLRSPGLDLMTLRYRKVGIRGTSNEVKYMPNEAKYMLRPVTYERERWLGYT